MSIFDRSTLICLVALLLLVASQAQAQVQNALNALQNLNFQPNAPDAEKAMQQYLQVMRGLIQNELDVLDLVCELGGKEKQAIADLAEQEWKVSTRDSVKKCIDPHVYGTIDLDGLAERITRRWLVAVASPDQTARYDQELVDRMEYRKRAVISMLLDNLVAKLNLSSSQMEQIEEVLNEKWRDRWYRSVEATFSNATLLPEIRPAWISSILSVSQRAALVTRDTQTNFRAHQVTQDSPSLKLDKRFMVGQFSSSIAIDLATGTKKKDLNEGGTH